MDEKAPVLYLVQIGLRNMCSPQFPFLDWSPPPVCTSSSEQTSWTCLLLGLQWTWEGQEARWGWKE